MSREELAYSVRSVVEPALVALANDVLGDWLKDAKEFLADADGEAKLRFLDAIEDAKNFRVKALMATDHTMARDYARATETALRRAKTLMLAERIVSEEALANALIGGLTLALETMAKVGKLILVTVTQGLIGGTIKGFIGESDVADVASMFPGS